MAAEQQNRNIVIIGNAPRDASHCRPHMPLPMLTESRWRNYRLNNSLFPFASPGFQQREGFYHPAGSYQNRRWCLGKSWRLARPLGIPLMYCPLVL